MKNEVILEKIHEELKKHDKKLLKKIKHIPCYPSCPHFKRYVYKGLCRFCRCDLFPDLVVCGNCGNRFLKDK